MNTIKYIFRFVLALPITYGIGWALSILAQMVIAVAIYVITEIFRWMFWFDSAEVADDVAKNMILPGWGYISSIIHSPDWAARLTAIIATIALFIALGIIAYVVVVLTKVVKRSKFMAIVAGILLLLFAIQTFYSVYASEMYEMFGLEKGILFYVVSIVVMFFYSIINLAIIAMLWNGYEDK